MSPRFAFLQHPALVLVPAGALACLLAPVPVWIALLAGLALGLAGANLYPAHTPRIAHHLLQASVIGLGAGMRLDEVARAGLHSLGITFFGILFTLALGRWLGRRLGLTDDAALLISGGTAICGGSAIAALAGTLKPRSHDLAVALVTVFLLNAAALLIFPPIGHALGLTQTQFGWWAALAIHDTSSVVGAGLAYGAVAVGVATTVKLARALWIAPVTFWFAHRRRRNDPAGERRPITFPWFILGFLAVAAAVTFVAFPPALTHGVALVSHRALGLTLFLIGASVTRQALRDAGVRPLALGLVLWTVVGSASLLAVKAGLVG
jgi:uncharacterized integral membrane protein (TIGR00698 family)